MKPEKLIICGWGPYREKTSIDFTKMNSAGLFLITGPTGAGKTTVFDAIAYALYGVLSGEIREKGSVRSDFADPETKTYVELYMSHKKEHYHISRNPEYLRPKKRKSGADVFTKEKENAVLTMPDGTVIAGNQDVNAKIEELLQMDSRQFRQISMIAQGEFSKLLFASSTEKNTIFRELFGTGIYARIQAQLKVRSAHLYQQYMVYENKIEEDVHLLTFQEEEWKTLTEGETLSLERITEYLNKRLESETKTYQKGEKESVLLEESILSLQKEIEDIRKINARFKEWERKKQEVVQLQQKKPLMEELAGQIKTAKRAQSLLWEEKAVLQKEQAAAEIKKRIQSLCEELDKLRKQEKTLAGVLHIKEEAEEVFAIIQQIDEIEKNKKQQEKKKEALIVQLQKAREEYERAQKEAEEKNRCYEMADARYKKAVIGIAARMIKEGEPCPVCGSVEHPHVAHTEEEIPDEKELQQLKEKAYLSRQEENRLYEQALLLLNEEKHLTESLQEQEKQKKNLDIKMSAFKEEVLCYVRTHTKAELSEAVQKSIEIQASCTEKERILEENKKQGNDKKKEAEIERCKFMEDLKKNGFFDEADYKQAAVKADQLEKWEKEYRSYEDTLLTAEKMQEYLQIELQSYEIREETPFLLLCEEKQEELKKLRKQQEIQNTLISQIERSLSGIAKNLAKAEQLKKEYGIVKDLDDLANGNNARRLVLEQYVLAGYFEQILKAANIRLFQMTEGRYELVRAVHISDGRKKDNLEIEVMDFYTGKKRSVKTLSGGETFKASLAMALGLSDCIQAENGGIEVETLFIDEGFGALDEESLEQACSTLFTLAGKNRMVGVISHVAQLREWIDPQIIIEKRNNGSIVKNKFFT